MELNIGTPNPKQVLFLKANKKYVGFGGARGGGKSFAVRTKAKLLAVTHDGIKILIVRKSYPELLNNHINILRAELHGIATYNKSEKVFNFPNGSIIQFGYCANDGDLDQYQGAEYDVIFLDEATQLTEFQIKAIIACMRGANDHPKRCYFTCNPSGQGMQYIKRIFIDKKYEDGEDPDDYEFIQSLVTDNFALMQSNPDYIKQLEALPPKLKEGWLHGNWDIFEGQFFEDFVDRPEHYQDRQWTNVIEPFEIPDNWRIYCSLDWGYNKPFSIQYHAVSEDGVIYHFLEWYGCTKTPNEGVKWTPQQVFSQLAQIESEHRWLKGKSIQRVADPAIFSSETGESIAEVADRYGLHFSAGDNKRLAGWMQCHYRLQFDDNGFPMFYVFNTCKQFIRTIPTLIYDDHKPEDLDTDLEDHAADAWRYMLMCRPLKPRQIPVPDHYKDSPLYQVLDIPKKDIMPRPTRTRVEVINDAD